MTSQKEILDKIDLTKSINNSNFGKQISNFQKANYNPSAILQSNSTRNKYEENNKSSINLMRQSFNHNKTIDERNQNENIGLDLALVEPSLKSSRGYHGSHNIQYMKLNEPRAKNPNLKIDTLSQSGNVSPDRHRPNLPGYKLPELPGTNRKTSFRNESNLSTSYYQQSTEVGRSLYDPSSPTRFRNSRKSSGSFVIKPQNASINAEMKIGPDNNKNKTIFNKELFTAKNVMDQAKRFNTFQTNSPLNDLYHYINKVFDYKSVSENTAQLNYFKDLSTQELDDFYVEFERHQRLMEKIKGDLETFQYHLGAIRIRLNTDGSSSDYSQDPNVVQLENIVECKSVENENYTPKESPMLYARKHNGNIERINCHQSSEMTTPRNKKGIEISQYVFDKKKKRNFNEIIDQKVLSNQIDNSNHSSTNIIRTAAVIRKNLHKSSVQNFSKFSNRLSDEDSKSKPIRALDLNLTENEKTHMTKSTTIAKQKLLSSLEDEFHIKNREKSQSELLDHQGNMTPPGGHSKRTSRIASKAVLDEKVDKTEKTHIRRASIELESLKNDIKSPKNENKSPLKKIRVQKEELVDVNGFNKQLTYIGNFFILKVQNFV